jgi:hypothetical protein
MSVPQLHPILARLIERSVDEFLITLQDTAVVPPIHISYSLATKMENTLRCAWAPSTLSKYHTAVHRYISFCVAEGIPPAFRLPAPEATLCAFVANNAGRIAGATIRNDVSALKAWHVLNKYPWHGATHLKYTLRGADRLTPESSTRPLRPPISREMLLALHVHLDPTVALDACTAAVANTAFWSQCRLGEILSPRAKSYNPTMNPMAYHLKPSTTPAGSRILHLPNTKTRGKRGDNVYLCRQLDKTDPISALANHFSVNNITNDLPLFCYETGRNKHMALTKRKLLTRCNEIWIPLGYPAVSGHCFRIGGTTELLLCNIPTDVVKVLGRWSSDAFLTYWRSLELLAPLYIEQLRALPTAPSG